MGRLKVWTSGLPWLRAARRNGAFKGTVEIDEVGGPESVVSTSDRADAWVISVKIGRYFDRPDLTEDDG